MELCSSCGNPTAGDVTGVLYCVVCGMQSKPNVRVYGPGPFMMSVNVEQFEEDVAKARKNWVRFDAARD